MSTAVMTTSVFECSEALFKNTSSTKSKDANMVNATAVSSANSNNATNGGHVPLRRSYTSIMTTLIEQHRKLDRSASEPTSRYKTELCRPFEESGSCKYGDKCQFAHGYTELRNLARHPKYKTELCRTFHSIGFCPYGPRCHFIHNFEEARIHNQKVSDEIGLPQPNIMGLNPFLAAAAAAAAAAANSNNNNAGTSNNSNNTTSSGGGGGSSNNNNNNNGNSNAAAIAAVAAATAAAGAAAAASNSSSNSSPVSSANLSVGLLKQIAVASSSQEAAAVAAVTAAAAANNATPNLIRTNSLGSSFVQPNLFISPLFRTNSSLGSTHHHNNNNNNNHHHHHHHHHHRQTCANVAAAAAAARSSIVGSTRPKPLNLSPTFSLNSTADSCSPPSSLSQSPTNSMTSFFNDDSTQQGNVGGGPTSATAPKLSTTAFNFSSFGLIEPRQTPSPHANVCTALSSDDVAPRTPSPLSPNSESRLPVFNRISSTLGSFENLKI